MGERARVSGAAAVVKEVAEAHSFTVHGGVRSSRSLTGPGSARTTPGCSCVTAPAAIGVLPTLPFTSFPFAAFTAFGRQGTGTGRFVQDVPAVLEVLVLLFAVLHPLNAVEEVMQRLLIRVIGEPVEVGQVLLQLLARP